ncbi:MAG TPA: competence protein ComJ [Myxococcales bacterium]
MAETHRLQVIYRQLAVFDPTLPNPFNDWRDGHVQQGFAWRAGSVSFRTLDDGALDVECVIGPCVARSDAIRIIRVPFAVASSGEVEVATMTDSFRVSLSAGEYSLMFELGGYDATPWCRLIWHRTNRAVSAEIVRADPELDPPHPLVMEAVPATSTMESDQGLTKQLPRGGNGRE